MATTKNSAVKIAGVDVAPGSRVSISVPLAQLYTGASLSMPVQVINGRRPGPVLVVSAAIHGDELNGVEIIRRLLKRKALSKMRGTLIAVPIVNVSPNRSTAQPMISRELAVSNRSLAFANSSSSPGSRRSTSTYSRSVAICW